METVDSDDDDDDKNDDTGPRKPLFGSFINKVFVDTVKKENEHLHEQHQQQAQLLLAAVVEDSEGVGGGGDSEKKSVHNKNFAMDALYGADADSTTKSATTVAAASAQRSTAVTMTPIITTSPMATAASAVSVGSWLEDSPGLGTPGAAGAGDGAESPAERIALTPVRKLPPGSGSRKVNMMKRRQCQAKDIALY